MASIARLSLRRLFALAPLEDRCVPDAGVTTSETIQFPDTTRIVLPAETVAAETPEVVGMSAEPPVVIPANAKRYAVGSGAGANALVNIYDAKTNAIISTITPFGTDYTGGVRVAMADVTGDGVDDLIAATATGAGRVRVFDGMTGETIADFTPWSKSTGGAFVAAADVTGNGRVDVVIGSGAGVAPEVRVYEGEVIKVKRTIVTAPTAVHTFTPSGASSAFGVRVAAGDLNGDGKAEVITGSKNSVFANKLTLVHENVNHYVIAPSPRTVVSASQIQFSPASDTAGVFVAVGDYSGTGRNDVAVGYTANKMARIRVVNGVDRRTRVMDAFSFVAGPDGGVVVAMKDVSNDGKADVIAAGAYGTSIVRILGGGTGGLMASFTAFGSSYQGGVFVG
jgi:fibronectin-binding autotransporter adhesin